MQILRPKGYLGAVGHLVALVLIVVPLFMLTARLLAMPDMRIGEWPVFAQLAEFGDELNAGLTLGWVPYEDRHKVEYLLLLPTASLLIVLTRLTLGLRVLGYRSILMAVGFSEVGFVASAMAMVVVFGVVAMVRPGMRQVRLPMYARVSMIISITACILIAFLLIGMWRRSELVWSLAYFPVVILAMMAEAIAGAMDTNTVGSAAWRLGWTLALALVLYALMHSPLMTLMLLVPEVLLLELGLIVLISEYLDLRLMQDWQTQGAQLRERYLPWWPAEVRRPRVAVVHNRSAAGVIGTLGPAPQLRPGASSQHLIDGLRAQGYHVKVFEGDMRLLRELGKFLPPHPRTGAPGGVVLNLSEGIQGEDRHCHVPAMLEMAGLPYTGPAPASHVCMDDPVLLRLALAHAGVPVAADKQRGRELHVGILGGLRLRAFPPALALPQGSFQCPARIGPDDTARALECAFRAFRAAGCRDFAVVRLLLAADGSALVAGVHAQGVFGRHASTATMLRAAGMGWGDLAREMVEAAARRHGVDWVQRKPVQPVPLPATPPRLPAKVEVTA